MHRPPTPRSMWRWRRNLPCFRRARTRRGAPEPAGAGGAAPRPGREPTTRPGPARASAGGRRSPHHHFHGNPGPPVSQRDPGHRRRRGSRCRTDRTRRSREPGRPCSRGGSRCAEPSESACRVVLLDAVDDVVSPLPAVGPRCAHGQRSRADPGNPCPPRRRAPLGSGGDRSLSRLARHGRPPAGRPCGDGELRGVAGACGRRRATPRPARRGRRRAGARRPAAR